MVPDLFLILLDDDCYAAWYNKYIYHLSMNALKISLTFMPLISCFHFRIISCMSELFFLMHFFFLFTRIPQCFLLLFSLQQLSLDHNTTVRRVGISKPDKLIVRKFLKQRANSLWFSVSAFLMKNVLEQ